ncbi:hypothetical protein PG988_011385 [Apiospora saccharicola]
MSWAASRVTTRIEDRAYSLLGIFGVNMPMLYGEGAKAFIRLQHEIIKTTNDLSIFAWIPKEEDISLAQGRKQQCHLGVGLLAAGPELFTHSQPIERILDSVFDGEFSVTNSGIKVMSGLTVYTNPKDGQLVYFLGLGYRLLGERDTNELGIDLHLCGPNIGIIESLRLQPHGSEQVYIVAEPGLLRAQGVRNGAFVFEFDGNSETYFWLNEIEPHPNTHYDCANGLFFTLKRPDFVGLLRLPQSFIYPFHDPIPILCGLKDESEPWCKIYGGGFSIPKSGTA